MLLGVRGYVLAGGESSRMQQPGLPADKAMLVWHGSTLLDRAIVTLQQVCESNRVLCGSAERCARMGMRDLGTCDRVAAQGPLGGVEAALADAAQAGISWALLLPVDMPWMTAEALLAFGRHALQAGPAAAWMQADGTAQPLPVLVSSAASALIGDRLRDGERKLLPTWKAIAHQFTPAANPVIVADALLPKADVPRWFQNVNTPGDLRLLQEHETLTGAPHQSTHAGQRASEQE